MAQLPSLSPPQQMILKHCLLQGAVTLSVEALDSPHITGELRKHQLSEYACDRIPFDTAASSLQITRPLGFGTGTGTTLCDAHHPLG